MPVPRVFVSSTFYDLRYIRENLRIFIRNMGFEPILSEKGNVFYDPKLSAPDSCLTEVSSCQLFVLIVGGRFGSQYKDTTKSITNCEYEEAFKKKVPVFTLIEKQVYGEYKVFQHNKTNKDLDASIFKLIKYPSIDSLAIFDFIERVTTNSINNAIEPFSEYNEIESYLKQQWAGLMYNFLTHQTDNEKISSSLDAIQQMSSRVEFLSKQILTSVGTDMAKLTARIYEKMFDSEAIKDLGYVNARVTIKDILQNKDYDSLTKGKFNVIKTSSYSISSSGEIAEYKYERDKKDYTDLRTDILKMISDANKTPQEVIRAYEG